MNNVGSYPYISSYTFRENCDHGMMLKADTKYVRNLGNSIDPDSVKDGDWVYLVTENVPYFFEQIDPYIDAKYHLICGRSDITITNEYAKYLNDKILSWSGPNMTADCDNRFQPIPLGLQNLHWKYDNNPQSDPKLLEEVMNEGHPIENDVLLTFRINTNKGERQKCFDHFKDESFIKIRNYSQKDRSNRDFVKDYFREIKRSKFVLCPWGNGYDCHRNYEVWYLGGIPIIKKSKVFREWEDLPAWWVDDWSEVNKESINKKYEEIRPKQWNRIKLYMDYWLNKKI